MLVKKSNKVRTIADKGKGVETVVLKALLEVSRVIVEGVAIVKRRQKPNNESPQDAIVEREVSIHVSSVQIPDKSGIAGRVGYRVVDGKKVRHNKKSDEVLD